MSHSSEVCELTKLTVALVNDLRDVECRITKIEEDINNMATKNELAILAVADSLSSLGQSLGAAIGRVEAKLNDMGVAEDLTEELSALTNAATSVQNASDRLNVIAPEVAQPAPTDTTTPTEGGTTETPANPIEGQPIDRDNVPETPLAGSSGGTDGVVTGDPIPPGQEPANPTESGTGSSDTAEVDEEIVDVDVDEEEE